jgi:hypothetical protein
MQPIELPAVSEDDMSRKPTNESTDPLTGRLGAARGRTAKAAGISRSAVKSRCACERGAWDQLPCGAVRCSGGFKSLWRSNEGRHIQKRG